jgi:hypothetical protein
MHQLRTYKFIARLVLAWFVLFVGASIASSLIKPTNLQLVCSAASSMKLIDVDYKNGNGEQTKQLDCPLCLTVTAPPVFYSLNLTTPSPLAHALLPIEAAHIASITAPPLPSRGPPNLLI